LFKENKKKEKIQDKNEAKAVNYLSTLNTRKNPDMLLP